MTRSPPLPPGFVEWHRNGTDGLVRSGYEPFAELLGLAGVPASREGVRGGRATHPVVTLPTGERAVVRRFLRGGIVRHFNRDRYFHGHRGWDELHALELAAAAGVRVPRPLAAVERRGLVGYRASLATRWIAGATDLDAWLRDAREPERCEAMTEVGRQIARMHDAGIAHPDLNLRNVLVAPDGVYLLDFDRVKLGGAPVGEPRRRRDLLRLRRSAVKLGAPVSADAWAALWDAAGYVARIGGEPSSSGRSERRP